jgi:hypothetical protein
MIDNPRGFTLTTNDNPRPAHQEQGPRSAGCSGITLDPIPEVSGRDMLVAGEMPSWNPVELQIGVSKDVVTLVGRDILTGEPCIKIELRSEDATEEWVPWLTRYLHRRRFGTNTLRLMEETAGEADARADRVLAEVEAEPADA